MVASRHRSAQVIGVYPVEADQPCHLVEVLVRDPDGKFKLDDLTQAADADRGYWQAPYDERFLDVLSGEPLAVRAFDTPDREEYRLAFFFHYLDLAKPLESSFGPFAPTATVISARVSWPYDLSAPVTLCVG